jgi:excisionase family DNA binding protein
MAATAPEKLLLTITETQEATGLSRTTIYGLMRSGELPVVRIGTAVRISAAGLRAWVAERQAGGHGGSE